MLGEITQANTNVTELKNDAPIVTFTVTGDASFNSDVSYYENLDIAGQSKNLKQRCAW